MTRDIKDSIIDEIHRHVMLAEKNYGRKPSIIVASFCAMDAIKAAARFGSPVSVRTSQQGASVLVFGFPVVVDPFADYLVRCAIFGDQVPVPNERLWV